MEENKLIAEFMGQEFESSSKDWEINRCLNNGRIEKPFVERLDYDVSWDWLMPVVEKIRKCKCYDKGDVFNYHFIIYNNRAEYYAGGYSKKPSKIFLGYGKEGTYKAVVEFIKEYNK